MRYCLVGQMPHGVRHHLQTLGVQPRFREPGQFSLSLQKVSLKCSLVREGRRLFHAVLSTLQSAVCFYSRMLLQPYALSQLAGA